MSATHQLGLVVRRHQLTRNGLVGWLGAALACPFFLHFAFTARPLWKGLRKRGLADEKVLIQSAEVPC